MNTQRHTYQDMSNVWLTSKLFSYQIMIYYKKIMSNLSHMFLQCNKLIVTLLWTKPKVLLFFLVSVKIIIVNCTNYDIYSKNGYIGHFHQFVFSCWNSLNSSLKNILTINILFIFFILLLTKDFLASFYIRVSQSFYTLISKFVYLHGEKLVKMLNFLLILFPLSVYTCSKLVSSCFLKKIFECRILSFIWFSDRIYNETIDISFYIPKHWFILALDKCFCVCIIEDMIKYF